MNDVAMIVGAGGLSGWTALLTAAAALLLVGSVLGNLAVARRRTARRRSIYEALRRQLGTHPRDRRGDPR